MPAKITIWIISRLAGNDDARMAVTLASGPTRETSGNWLDLAARQSKAVLQLGFRRYVVSESRSFRPLEIELAGSCAA